ncbi:MAG TPA: glutaredoxin family protein [Ramlibacter sp.]|nr:glutaredoxin family protein [Ramlibacter sp.]
MVFFRPLLVLLSLMGLLAVAGFGGSDANAQQIFRTTSPDGRITFSDQAPLDANARARTAIALPLPSAATDNAALPFELRQVAARYPVTLYTGPDCAPCGLGRVLLSSRGIPFTELTVTTNDDIDALKRLAGAPSLPFLTIGGQHIKGFSDVEWAQFLDAAGYPKTSQLPSTYERQAAKPLVVAQQAQPLAPAVPEAARAAAPPPAAAPSENPSGIRF